MTSFFCIRAVTPKVKKCGFPVSFSQLQKGIGIAVVSCEVSLRMLQRHTVLELEDVIEDLPGGPVLKPLLPLQGAMVQSLI